MYVLVVLFSILCYDAEIIVTLSNYKAIHILTKPAIITIEIIL